MTIPRVPFDPTLTADRTTSSASPGVCDAGSAIAPAKVSSFNHAGGPSGGGAWSHRPIVHMVPSGVRYAIDRPG